MICLCEQDVTPNDPDAVFHRFPSGIEGYIHNGCLTDWEWDRVKDEVGEELPEPPEDIE